MNQPEILNYNEVKHETNGTIRYLLNGFLHRIDGPALIFNDGSYGWFLYDQLHRIDGPAIHFQNGKYDEYWVNNTCYSYEDFKLIVFIQYGQRIN